MRVVFPHGTTKAQAMEELKAHGAKMMARFGSEVSELQQEWKENRLTFSFRAQGVAISGRLVVGEQNAEMEANLPLMATLFEGQIRERVLEAMREVFAPEIQGKEKRT